MRMLRSASFRSSGLSSFSAMLAREIVGPDLVG
jgi:hypothetical protein